MNTLLLILMIALVILAIARIVLVIFNPTRDEKITGIISSFTVFIPMLVLWANKDYYFGPTPLLVKIFVIVACSAFCVVIFFANYSEYKDCKEYKVFTKKQKQQSNG